MARLLSLLALASTAVGSSILFEGGTVISWDDASSSTTITRNASLLITDDTITGIYAAGESVPRPSGNDTQIIDATDKILTPGFIDTHRHGWQTAYRTLGSNTSLWEYFGRYGEYASAGRYTADDVYLSQLTGLYEAINAGVTTTLDHASHTWSNETAEAGLRASVDSGARVFWAYAIRDITDFTIAEQIGNFRDLARAAIYKGTPTSLGIAHDTFSSDAEGAAAVVALAKELNVSVITTHLLEGPWGFSNSPELLQSLDILNTSIPVVFSHASFLGFTAHELLKATDQHISITPESELHYGHLHPTSHLLLDQASLGVDTHFTFSTDILTQARLWLQRVRALFYAQGLDAWKIPVNSPMSAGQAFMLATAGGARALRRRDLGGPWGFSNSPELLQSLDILNTSIPVVFSHASFLGFTAHELLKATDQHISITPESELHYGHLHPTSHLLLDQASLGVDTHFTFSTDILTQARLWLQRVRAIFYAQGLDAWKIPVNNPMSASQAFMLATAGGARALRRRDLGVLAPGAKADVVLWDGAGPALLGWDDPVAAVMLHASVADIDTVVVNGVVKKRAGRLVVDGYDSLKTRFLASARRIQRVLKDTPLPAPTGAFMSGAELTRVQEADVVRGNGTGY
ncbi:5-methylthioadenosine/S-adenosylhomocysteine deaminase 1 like protein [Verticillium longisporum]|nr:5-methylthioadenosine/S-adenosylhomocysteine deaminase 1 like protein [Verticillium longisporum]